MGHWTGYSLAVDPDCGCCVWFPTCCADVGVPNTLHLTITGVTAVGGTTECDCLVGQTVPLVFTGGNFFLTDPPCGWWWCGTVTCLTGPLGPSAVSIFLVCDDCSVPGTSTWLVTSNRSTCNPVAPGGGGGSLTAIDCGPPFEASGTTTPGGFCNVSGSVSLGNVTFTITV